MMGSECKRHYDLSMSKRTRKPLKEEESDPQLVTAISPERENLPRGVDEGTISPETENLLHTGVDEGTICPETENLPKGVDEGEVTDHRSLKQMIIGDGEVKVISVEGEGEVKVIMGEGDGKVEVKVIVGEGDGEVIVGEVEGERIVKVIAGEGGREAKAIVGEGQVKRRERNRGGNSLGHHFTEEKQLQLVVKQQGEGVEGKKLSGMVSRYVKVLSHLIKVKRDPRLGSRKKPVLQLTM